MPPWVVATHQQSVQSDVEQRTPDLKAVVQEVVNSPGWVRGKDLVVVVTGSGHRTADSFDGHPNKATTITIAVREGGATVGVPDMYGVSGDYAHPNLLTNGELDGPVGDDRENHITGWNTNNAQLAIVDHEGRAGVLQVGDQGSFSEISQAIPTVEGAQYTLSFDVFIDLGQMHAIADFCSSGDSRATRHSDSK